ncbi:MAG TPA: transglycosylase family protein [Acidimicrobiales bacterium]|nr:transglycosylase family protein [Acidimicrobiales bacterium]
MRKQHRIAATAAAFLLSTGMVAVDLVATAQPASAATYRRPRRRYIPRPQAPATAANFARLRQCESGGNYATRTGNGYYGAYQFSPRTWRSLGFTGLPSDASPDVQDAAAAKLQARSGWAQWPACSRALGLR